MNGWTFETHFDAFADSPWQRRKKVFYMCNNAIHVSMLSVWLLHWSEKPSTLHMYRHKNKKDNLT